MPRARNIKHSFFTNEHLVDLPYATRLLFIGLWTLADREGRLADKPKRIKMDLFPADRLDVDDALMTLAGSGFIQRYVVDDTALIQVTAFTKHQNPHKAERPSTLPAPSMHDASTVQAPCKSEASTSLEPDLHQSSMVVAGLIPDCGFLIPDSKHERASRFAAFWKSYPKKRGKVTACKAYTKLNPDDALATVIDSAVARQVSSDPQWLSENGRFIPHPATYLNSRLWEDETAIEVTAAIPEYLRGAI